VSTANRTYKRKYQTIGHEILDIESEACGVPDEAYKLLDELIDHASSIQLPPPTAAPGSKRQRVVALAKGIAQLLIAKGFELYIPTKTLGDALSTAAGSPPSKHLFDCDTGSLMYMSIAQHLGFSTWLVEVTLPSGSGHNYVRWALDGGETLDWDTNGQAECKTPAGQQSYQGVSMSTDAVKGYIHWLRGSAWKEQGELDRARADYKTASALDPTSPHPFNQLAWLIVTEKALQKPALKAEALAAATRAVEIHRLPNYLDTLACAHAAQGDFSTAEKVASEALAGDSENQEFQSRLKRFKAKQDCVGL